MTLICRLILFEFEGGEKGSKMKLLGCYFHKEKLATTTLIGLWAA
jgi:hypothetical protein